MLKKTSHNADDPDIVCKIFNAGPQTADAADHHVNFYTSFRCFYQFRNDFFICQGINLDADITFLTGFYHGNFIVDHFQYGFLETFRSHKEMFSLVNNRAQG